MKFPVLGVIVACLPFLPAPTAICQQQNSQPERPYLAHVESPRLYFTMPPTERRGRVELAASNAQLDLGAQANLTSAEIESVLRLRGNVQVVMCSPGGHGCDNGSILVRADAVDYNEKTGAMDVHGDVHIDAYRNQSPKTQ
jgi:lipopolysaccharide assembly outer membrane protein LptD (OstA)